MWIAVHRWQAGPADRPRHTGDALRGRLTVDVAADLFTVCFHAPLFNKISHDSFEKELTEGKDFKITTSTFLKVMRDGHSSLTEETIRELEADSGQFTRY